MVAHNANKDIYFTDPSIRTKSAFINFLQLIHNISTVNKKYIANLLCSLIFNKSDGFTDQFTWEVLSILNIKLT